MSASRRRRTSDRVSPLRDVSAGPEALDSRFRACSECLSMLRWALWPMLENVSGINSSTALWYASRATGVVALLLLTAVVLLGLMVTRQGRLPRLPPFALS